MWLENRDPGLDVYECNGVVGQPRPATESREVNQRGGGVGLLYCTILVPQYGFSVQIEVSWGEQHCVSDWKRLSRKREGDSRVPDLVSCPDIGPET